MIINVFLSLPHALVLLEQYKYLIIFPIMVIEGPIVTVISGFLVYLGFLNIFITFPLLVVGDLIGDALHYILGKYGRRSVWIMKSIRFLGYSDDRENLIEEHFKKHLGKTLLLAKVSHGVGGIIQIASGVVRVNFYEFLKYCFVGTVPKALVLFVVGFYLGSSYAKIDNFFDTIALITFSLVVFVFAYLILKGLVKNFLVRRGG